MSKHSPVRRLLRIARGSALFLIWSFPSVSAFAEPTAGTSVRPNVVVIVVDDMGYADLGVQGAKDLRTPHIDALSREGMRFTNAYVTGPYCSPSRAGLLTGRYQERFGHDFNPEPVERPGMGLPLDEQTLADAFKSAGYRTSAIGKWHLGAGPEYRPTKRGFDEFFGFLVAQHPYLADVPGKRFPGIVAQEPGKFLRDEEAVVDEPAYSTDAFAREANAFIERNRERPFFLYLATNAVHTPLQATDEQLRRIDPSVTGKRRTYVAMVQALDDAVGRVVETIKRNNLDEKTLVFFLNDNGGPESSNASDNGPLRGGKATVYEGGVRVPFFVRWPGRIPAGVVSDAVIAQIDIFPTALAAAKIDPIAPDRLDGVNLLPWLEGSRTDDAHPRLFWRFGQQFAVREGPWKLTRGPDVEKPQLFDLRDDLGESNDVSDQHPQIVERLTRAWAEWNKQNIPPRWIPGRFKD